ncbi:hypothetical protein [Entomomonas asaccharolytica]|uniref:Uncharacterized protein n=1 Tax=Entomomonas asaccharolytica TaxID=2785331 RepID=A0A974RW41_9GAMM|nr:hypothetical protein [Entomomonas asaccharolytica]QQP84682.1 hypothetical protein JHT90_09700 [Entomomonas asaccharolytica]
MASENSINWEITPENSGINIKRTIDKGSVLYGGVEISGVPNYQRNIKIHLYGYGSPPPLCTFDRVLTLKVNALIKQDIKD